VKLSLVTSSLEAILLSALPKDTTSKLAGLPSRYPFFMRNIKQGSCKSRVSTKKFPEGAMGKTRLKNSTIMLPSISTGIIYKNSGGPMPLPADAHAVNTNF